jgi:capsular polysaccharide biosynthesis protein
MVAGVIVAILIYLLVLYIDKKLQVKEEIRKTKIAYSK